MRADPSELLQQGQDALNRGENARALNIFSNLVKIGPHSVGAWCGYAASLYGSGRFERALSAAKEAVRLGPDDFRTYSVLAPPAFLMDCEVGIQTCRDYILTLSRNDAESLAGFWSSRLAEKDHFIAAARAFSFFAERYLDEEDTAHELAHHYLNAQELDKVEDLLGVIEKNFGDSAAALCMRARIEIIRGDAKAAKAAALKAIELNARAIPAYVILSELSPELVDASIEERLKKALDEGALPDEMRIGGYRALGRAAEKKGDFNAAFDAFDAAKRLAKSAAESSGRVYRAAAVERRARLAIARYPAAPSSAAMESAPPDCVFIVGMPRSGSTLIDQVVSSHSRAVSIGESANMAQIANSLEAQAKSAGRAWRSCVADAREHYRSAYRNAAAGAACVLDKNLFNFERCGLIADLDPGARFIAMQRDPADIAMSVFRTRFLAAHEWSNDLRDIAHMQATYEFLIERWRRILGERIHVVKYEELVSDFETGVRAVLDFCGLDLEQQCLEYYKGDRTVFTVSAVQVRRPINADGVARWRGYEKRLAPFFQSLEEFRRRYAQS